MSSESRPPAAAGVIAAAPVMRSRRGERFRQLFRNQLAMAGALILALVAFAALFAPYLSPEDPLEMNPALLLQGPSAEHWMGTDEFGRDILSRVIWGARISLYVGGIAVTIARPRRRHPWIGRWLLRRHRRRRDQSAA